jgi:hypothetical protein
VIAHARFAVATPAPCAPLHARWVVRPEPPTTGTTVAADTQVPGRLPEQEGTRMFCAYRNISLADKLTPGAWTIELAPFGACTVQLGAGANAVFFSSASTGCSTKAFP